MVDLTQYLPILIFLVIAVGLSSAFVFLPMGVARLTGAHKPDPAKHSEYECGFPAFEDARSQFDVLVNQQLLNVEQAYWTLYTAYYRLHFQQEALAQAFDALKFIRQRVVGELETDPSTLPQLEASYHNFYVQVIDARARLLDADRALRGLLGLRSDDGTLLTPTDEPLRAPVKVTWAVAP